MLKNTNSKLKSEAIAFYTNYKKDLRQGQYIYKSKSVQRWAGGQTFDIKSKTKLYLQVGMIIAKNLQFQYQCHISIPFLIDSYCVRKVNIVQVACRLAFKNYIHIPPDPTDLGKMLVIVYL